MFNQERDSSTLFDLKTFSLPESKRFERQQLPGHVLRGDDLYNAVNAILKSDCNAAVIHSQTLYSSDFLDELKLMQLDLRGKGEKCEGISDSVLQLMKDKKRDISPAFERQIGDLTIAMSELVTALSMASTSVSFHIYNGTTRPTHFHDDKNMIAALRTLSGPSTIFINNRDAIPKKSGQPYVNARTETYSLNEDEILLFRGGLPIDGFREGLVHRAPNYSGLDRIFFSVSGPLDTSRLIHNDAVVSA